jgi:hypothetical protein
VSLNPISLAFLLIALPFRLAASRAVLGSLVAILVAIILWAADPALWRPQLLSSLWLSGFGRFLSPARGEGELAVRAAFANATLVRPAVIFGPDDAFLTTLLKLLSQLPIYPMFGRGLTKLQPAYVEDVAEAIVRTLKQTDSTWSFES